ncbi:MAG: dienelactone hydrolase family protein [Balneolaceae bacterium]|nr:dienelactone hydrolase family protein [Balneolaceae bacterium]MDR9407377.1 dienelactone hydrolase family protein [Balneolaceae bacterium]
MNDNNNDEFLISGKSSFCYDVPFRVHETGTEKIEKPLVLYLHGFKDNLEVFSERCSEIVDKVEAYHLFIQGPYPIYDRRSKKKVKDWGASWYLYDGEQEQFLSSLEQTSVFIDKILKEMKNSIKVERTCLIGYSMGGYLAGYYSLTRPKLVNELIVAGARIKTEILEEKWELISHLNILALHGEHDKLVDYQPQRNEIKRLINHNVSAEFKLIDQKHRFNDEFISLICEWLSNKNYRLFNTIK